MSWQAYVDDHLLCDVDGNHLTHAAIVGQDGSVWAQSANFPQVPFINPSIHWICFFLDSSLHFLVLFKSFILCLSNILEFPISVTAIVN